MITTKNNSGYTRFSIGFLTENIEKRFFRNYMLSLKLNNYENDVELEIRTNLIKKLPTRKFLCSKPSFQTLFTCIILFSQ